MLDHYYSVGGYDLLLLDIQLPGMDGVSLARQIRLNDAKVIIVFITNMTAYAVHGYGIKGIRLAVEKYNGHVTIKQEKGVQKKRTASSFASVLHGSVRGVC